MYLHGSTSGGEARRRRRRPAQDAHAAWTEHAALRHDALFIIGLVEEDVLPISTLHSWAWM
jgi:hypothetical protein